MDTATILTHHRRKLIQSGSTDNSVITGQWSCLPVSKHANTMVLSMDRAGSISGL